MTALAESNYFLLYVRLQVLSLKWMFVQSILNYSVWDESTKCFFEFSNESIKKIIYRLNVFKLLFYSLT